MLALGDERPRGRINSQVPEAMSNLNEERVLAVRHWTDNLFSFVTTRDPGFRFQNGQFTMIGLWIEGRPLLRAYSMASANYEERLEFFSIKVANGPLTSRLQHLNEGDRVLVGRKPTGTLLIDNLLPGKNLYLLGTGTGLAPFLSLIKDPEIYERFERVVLVHGCRRIAELAYMETITEQLPNDPFLGDLVKDKLIYYPTVTREPFRHNGRITALIESGKLFQDIGLPSLDRESDRVMLCGSPHMLADLQTVLAERKFNEGSHSTPGHFVIEKAFVEK
jgi:ferredoxin/flavodoxin---NADP+ reductase